MRLNGNKMPNWPNNEGKRRELQGMRSKHNNKRMNSKHKMIIRMRINMVMEAWMMGKDMMLSKVVVVDKVITIKGIGICLRRPLMIGVMMMCKHSNSKDKDK